MKLIAVLLPLGLALGLQQRSRPAAPSEGAERSPIVAEVGKPLPVFRLNDHEGNLVTIGGAREEGEEWTVIAFYPKAMTPG